jgi:hypothetical protein
MEIKIASGITDSHIEEVRGAVSAAALDPKLMTMRKELALLASHLFGDA